MPHAFDAPVLSGAKRGTQLGFPTLNLDPTYAPASLEEGIYAAQVSFGGRTYPAAVHYGPRLFFDGNIALEVHIIDETIDTPPLKISVAIVEHLRDVQNFSDETALKEQIAMDVDRSRKILEQ